MSAVQLFSEKINSTSDVKITEQELLGLLLERDVITERKNFLIYQALLLKKINPDSVLVVVPQVSFDENGLVPFAMALKMDADPNAYVKQPGTTSIHIIPFLLKLSKRDKFDIITDEKTTQDFLILLLLSGADLNSPYFKPDPKKKLSPNVERVLYRINGEGFNLPLFEDNNFDPEEIMKALQDKKFDKYRIMLDQAGKNQDSFDTAKMCIKFFSPSIFDLQLVTRKERGADLVNLAVRHYNKMAYDKLLAWGFLPSYFLVNEMLLEIRTSLHQKDPVTAKLLQDMIIESVGFGLELDIHQLNLAGNTSANFRSVLEEKYSIPLWRKICRTREGAAPLKLKTLAASLNLNVVSAKASICDELDKVSDTQEDEFLRASRKKQNDMYRAELSTIGDYVDDETMSKDRLQQEIENSDLKDPSSYNRYNVAVYRDEQGNVWFFDSGEFLTLMTTKVNPRTNAFLPEEFLTKVQGKIDMLKSLGVADPISYETIEQAGINQQVKAAFDRFKTADRVSSISNERALEDFYALGSRYNVSRTTLSRLTVEQLKEALPNNYNYLGLNQLGDKGYVLVTVARIINASSDDVRRDFFSNVRTMTSRAL